MFVYAHKYQFSYVSVIRIFILKKINRYTGVSLNLCCFVVYSTRRFVLSLALCCFVLVFFSPFSIKITSLGEERAILMFFVRLFDLRLFGFVCCLFLLVSVKGCGL